jgi:hypothetical protein
MQVYDRKMQSENSRNVGDATIEIRRAILEECPVLSNLYQLYIHDFTDFVERPLGNDGRFDYDPLPLESGAPTIRGQSFV